MIKLAIKDIRLFFADKRAMLLTFAVPIALITLFAFAFGGAGQSDDEESGTTLLIADEDSTQESKRIIAVLDSLKEYDVVLTSLERGEKLVKKGSQAAVLVFHKGFSDSMNAGATPPLEFKYDAAKDAEVYILQGALRGTLSGILGSRPMERSALDRFDRQNPDMDAATRQAIHAQISENFAPGEAQSQSASIMKTTPLIAAKENSPGLIHAVAGTAIMMLLFSVVGVGASLLDEKEQGTLKKLLYSPLQPNSILFGKMLSTNFVSILQLVVMFIFAWLVFGLDIMSHIPELLLMILATSYACAGFGVLLASFARSRQQVQGLSTLIVLVMSCIGGSMIPTFIMPLFMQKLAVVSVNYWGIQGFYDIFWRALPLTDTTFLTRVLVLALIGTVLNLLALRMFRKNILKIA